MGSYQSPLSAIIKGAVAGAAGTYVMGEAMARAPRLLEQLGYQLPDAPSGPAAPDSPTEEVAERMAEGVAQQSIDQETKEQAWQVIHWSYGSAWARPMACCRPPSGYPPAWAASPSARQSAWWPIR